MSKVDTEQLFLNNENLIYFTMKKYFPHIYYNLDSREEYYQVGSIGLLKACKKYDSSVSKFSTYAVPMIWGEIKRNIRDTSNTIHFSRRLIDIANNLIRVYNESEIDEDYENWIEKQLLELDISDHDKIGVRNYLFKPLALETKMDDEDKLTIMDAIASPTNVEDDIIFEDYINNISKSLQPRDKDVLYRLINGETQTSIASICGVSQAQVSRIERKIKMLATKQLFDIGSYDTAIDKIFILNPSISTMSEFEKICQQYQMDISKCPKSLIEKRIKPMQENIQKIYSKKSCQKLILKCVMKLLLQDKEPSDNDGFRNSVKKLLMKNDYNNESLFNHLNSMVTSQIKSCIDFAKKNIEKYNYKREYEIVVDELDFKPSKFIKKDSLQEIKLSSPKSEPKTPSSDNIVDSILTLLEQFRRDNLMVRF